MLTNPTLELMRKLRLEGMATRFEEQLAIPNVMDQSFEQRLEDLLSAQQYAEENRRFKRLLQAAKLKDSTAVPEDIDYRSSRGLSKAQVADLLLCDWVRRHLHVILVGLTGTGKTWLACALAVSAIRMGMPALYFRLGRLLEASETARGDGSLVKLRAKVKKAHLLILDDWGVNPLTSRGRQDLLEFVEDRNGSGSILITSQLPIDKWHDFIGEPTVADAILDRVVHRAHRLNLNGDSLRKIHSPLQNKEVDHADNATP